MADIFITDSPERTATPGQWRLSLNTSPSAPWISALMERVMGRPARERLSIVVEEATLCFTASETGNEMLDAIGTLYRLLRETNASR